MVPTTTSSEKQEVEAEHSREEVLDNEKGETVK
jgi:hypothetical protein